MYLLDTNAVIGLLAGNKELSKRLRERPTLDFGIPAIVAHELYFGAFKSKRAAANLDLIQKLRLPIIEFDHEDAKHAGQIRAALQQEGAPIGPYDVLIAGQARARRLTLITRNLREFRRVEGLNAENWQD